MFQAIVVKKIVIGVGLHEYVRKIARFIATTQSTTVTIRQAQAVEIRTAVAVGPKDVESRGDMARWIAGKTEPVNTYEARVKRVPTDQERAAMIAAVEAAELNRQAKHLANSIHGGM